MGSRWVRCISTSGMLRGVAIEATELVQSMVDRHGVKGLQARGLGEATLGGLVLATGMKSGERVNLNIQGNAHYQIGMIDAHPEGTVRGYVIERADEAIPNEVIRDFGPWGSGTLSVLRTKFSEGEQPYIGTVPLLTGHLAKDLTFYFVQSEQIPTALGFFVKVRDENKIEAAGGFLVQALPGASSTEIATLEAQATDAGKFLEDVVKAKDPKALLARLFQGGAFQILEEKTLKFECQCSLARVERAIALVGPFEIQAMIDSGKPASVNCDFCSTVYTLDETKLREILSGLVQKIQNGPKSDQ